MGGPNSCDFPVLSLHIRELTPETSSHPPATTAYWLAARHEVLGARSMILVALGWTVWLFWCVAAPHPHLRYLWPSLATFAVPAGLSLGALFDHRFEGPSRRHGLRIAIGCVALCLVANGCLGGLRGGLVGDMNLLTWEWARAGFTRADAPRRLRAAESE